MPVYNAKGTLNKKILINLTLSVILLASTIIFSIFNDIFIPISIVGISIIYTFISGLFFRKNRDNKNLNDIDRLALFGNMVFLIIFNIKLISFI